MKSSLDMLDCRIIRLLQENGRMPSSEIARQLDVSERTVRHRVDRMVEKNVIFPTVVVNHKYFGYPMAVDIFCEVEINRIEEVGNKLKQYPETNYIAFSFGDQDLSIQALFETTDAAYAFVQKLANIPGILRTKIVFVPRVIKNTHEWLPPETDFASYRKELSTDSD
jgi:Lrp/AsnC family transcriptional regulator for asnA, asnC and gidA